MDFYFYDTAAKELRIFEPIDSKEIGMYCCGPTVYNYAHIGNLRTYLFEDVLKRALRMQYSVKHVMNITDVGHLTSDADEGADKMEEGAKRLGKSAWEVAAMYEKQFFNDLSRLNILRPDIVCHATTHIKEQIEAIETIMSKGAAYITEDGVYFDTTKVDGYGKMAGLDLEGLLAGLRVPIGGKKNATDFALWKFSSCSKEKRQMEWASPWGVGWPGWHIECSAMATKYLGPLFDIHCGGKDHIPIHHTNEIAQTQVCHGTDLANYWMHGYFLELDREKLSKSSGNFITLETVEKEGIDPLAFRFMCLQTHYRSDMNFSWEGLRSSEIALNRLRLTLEGLKKENDSHESGVNLYYVQKFADLMGNDLGTPKVLALLWELLKDDNVSSTVKLDTVYYFDVVLGLDLQNWQPEESEVSQEIRQLCELRQKYRLESEWKKADEIRDILNDMGCEVEDTEKGYKISVKKQ